MEYRQIEETAEWLKAHTNYRPQIAIILGSGTGELADAITERECFPYSEIPNYPISTVPGHKGQLIFGKLNGVDVMAMQGRFHYYEGYSMDQVTLPERVMKLLGIKTLLMTNAAGGMNPEFTPGDLMIVTDHINNFPEHPLRGRNDDRFGTRFPDMGEVYTRRLIKIAKQVAEEQHLILKEGIYIGSSGPTFETPAEYRLFHLWGADATGMSSVPEAIVAHHSGLEVFTLSVITNCPDSKVVKEVTHEEVQQVAATIQSRLTALFSGMLPLI